MLISQGLLIIIASLCVLCLTASIISTIIGLKAIITVKAFEKSTHSITYQAIDPAESNSEEIMQNWVTPSAAPVREESVKNVVKAEDFQEEEDKEFPDPGFNMDIHSF